MSRIKNVLKQYKVPWIGGMKDLLGQLVLYVSMFNFALIVVTAYNTTIREYIIVWIPGFQLWMLFAILILIIVVLMIIEYKFIVPSLYQFRTNQMFKHESEIIDALNDIKKRLDEIEGKSEGDGGE